MRYLALPKRVNDAVRLAEVVQVLIKHGFTNVVQTLRLRSGLPGRMLRSIRMIQPGDASPETFGKRLRAAMTELGPTYVKLGQVLSTRPDLIPPALCADLAQLQDKVEALPFADLRDVFERGLGTTIDTAFAEFDETPVACASLSQVYKARLRSGETVAVKIRKPRVVERIKADLSLMRSVAQWIDEHVDDLDWLDATDLVKAFERSVLRELNFSIEGHTIQRFTQNFEDVDYLEIPRMYPDLSCDSVITMDWVDGVRVNAIGHFVERESDPKQVALNGCHAVFKQVFEDHLFHADPHPGNIFLTRENRIALIDFGMVGHLEREDMLLMTDLLRSVLRMDSHRATQCVLLITDATELDDVAALRQEIAEYLQFEARAIVASGQVGRALQRITAVLAHHGLQLPARFSLLIKALTTIESTAHELDPQLDTLPVMRPYIEAAVRSRFAPDEIVGEGQEYAMGLLRLLREIPGDIQNLFQKIRHGTIKMQVNHEGLDRLTHIMDVASNRVAFSVITGSLIIGSSWLLASGVGFRALGVAGFISAGVLGAGLLVSILRSRNF